MKSLDRGLKHLEENKSYKLSIQEPPPKEYVSKPISTFINWVEKLNIRYSVFGNPPFYDKSLFPWVAEVEKEWKTIRKELEQVLKRKEELPSFHEIVSEVRTITQDQNWKTFFLIGYGLKSEENCRMCPETTRILKKIPGLKTAFFSILSPNKYIPPHRGPYNGVLRYHLGLIVPKPEEKCRIRVGDEIRHWREGDSLIFDDTYEHEVWNETSGDRVVLFVDFVRPVKFPFNLLNHFVLNAAIFTPAIREAHDSHHKWEKRFYNKA